MKVILFNKATLRTKRKMTAGLSLVEIGIVLAIVGMVLGAVWVASAQVYLNQQVKLSAQDVISISHNVRAIFTEQGGVTGGTGSTINLALDQMKAFPLDMRTTANPTGNLSNRWSGVVQVFADNCAGNEAAPTAQPCFGLTFPNVPQSACIKLLSLTAQGGMGLQGVIVNGNAMLPVPVTVSTVETACNANINKILWVYLLKDST